jgi:Zn-dependent M28 family amino/carboxypeptidase
MSTQLCLAAFAAAGTFCDILSAQSCRVRREEDRDMICNYRHRAALGVLLAALVSGCSGAPSPSNPGATALDSAEITTALGGIQGSQIKQHMTVLADDALEGRGLGTAGYEGALNYVETTVKSYGLAPAGDGGGFRQRVPLRNGVVVENGSAMRVRSSAGERTLVYGKDYLLGADPLRDDVRIDDAPVVFVGYGVSAPGLGYDDYAAGADVKGKVVAYLSGAPAMLPSNERAYYSSGAAKEAEAVRRGAIGTISFTSPDDPRFRWDVSVATGKQGGYAWVDAQGNPNRGDPALRASASLNHSGVAALFAGASKAPAEIFAAAAKSTPQALALATRVSVVTRSTHKDVESANLVARLEGSDPALKNEHVVYVAHVDHFGRGVAMNGDEIYNGAHDNASGVAIVLEVARAYSALPARPRRSILFLFVTAEERGLLGSDYFARHPTVPADGIVADLTLDMPFLFHPLLDIVPYGAQHSTLSAPVARAAERLGVAVAADPIPEQVLFIRSDHFSFVRQGVPSLFIKSGFKTGDPAKDGAAINAGYRRDVYHKPNDDMSQPFDFEAGAAHARLNFLTGWQVAQDTARPAWNPGDFFGELFGQASSRDTGPARH